MTAEEFYIACNLTSNPFRSNPSSSADPRADIWVGYEKQQKQLVKFLVRTRADQIGNTNFVMLYGGYGTGKSHALLWAQNRILYTEKDQFNAVCYFVPTLKKAKGALTFAGAFVEDIVSKSTLLADVQAYRTFLGTCLFKYRDQEKIGNNVQDLDLIERLIPAVELYNFAKEIYRRELAEDFRELLVPRGLNDYQAVIMFTRLLNLFTLEIPLKSGKQRFRKAAYLLIDELDDLMRATAKEVREVNDALRHLYDYCPNCFCLVIALSAEVAELPAIFEDYILTRIQRQIVLELLDKDDAVTFVKEILDSARINKQAQKGFFPFDQAAVEAIISQLVEITPRKVVNTMQQIIEEVRLSGFDPKDGLITVAVLDEREILEEVFGNGGIG